jgi:hypothetical protein
MLANGTIGQHDAGLLLIQAEFDDLFAATDETA